jgi:hypothetical protein
VNYNYQGEYLAFVPAILDQYTRGRRIGEITHWCMLNAEKFNLRRPVPWISKSEYFAHPSEGVIRYILRKQGLMPWPGKKTKPKTPPPLFPQGRVIDMGGPRGVWIEHTPESTFREFNHN